ncbi:hypothetical protein GCM10028784_07660 [Myceligenerans cantabricum]
MTTQAAVLEPSRNRETSVRATTDRTDRTGRAERAARARRLSRWVVGAAVLAIAATLLVGWVSAARAATTDRLELLNARLDERVGAVDATSVRLDTVIVVAQNVREASAGSDPAALATLDASIRSAEAVVDQRVTTQAAVTVPQAEMLMEKAARMEQALALAGTDLRTAVGMVRSGRGDGPIRMFDIPGADQRPAPSGLGVVQP